jgi:hypothetical protein
MRALLPFSSGQLQAAGVTWTTTPADSTNPQLTALRVTNGVTRLLPMLDLAHLVLL